MTKKLDYEQIIYDILEEFAEIGTGKNKKVLIDIIYDLSAFEEICRSYPEITHVIYRMNNNTFHELEAFFGLSESNNDFAGLRQEEKLDGLSNEKKENLNRFERHVKLSCYQREYIGRLITEAEKAAEKAQTAAEDAEQRADITQKIVTSVFSAVKDTKAAAQNANKMAKKAQLIAGNVNETATKAQTIADNANRTATKAQRITNKVQKKTTGIYSEFVGILAIFTALSFAMMGSVQMLGNLFNDIKNPTTGSLGYALVLAGIYLIVIYLLIMTLVLAMKKLFSTTSDSYKFSWAFVWVISIAATLIILLGIFLIVLFKVSNWWTFYR